MSGVLEPRRPFSLDTKGYNPNISPILEGKARLPRRIRSWDGLWAPHRDISALGCSSGATDRPPAWAIPEDRLSFQSIFIPQASKCSGEDPALGKIGPREEPFLGLTEGQDIGKEVWAKQAFSRAGSPRMFAHLPPHSPIHGDNPERGRSECQPPAADLGPKLSPASFAILPGSSKSC